MTSLVLFLALLTPTPTLNHRVGPAPLQEEACDAHLDRLKTTMINIETNHAGMYIKYGFLFKDSNIDDFIENINTVKHSGVFKLNPYNCSKHNLTQLDLLLAVWQYNYAIDYEKVEDFKGAQ
jgi:hypothetical protein